MKLASSIYYVYFHRKLHCICIHIINNSSGTVDDDGANNNLNIILDSM
jgi:hypothetical protein